MEFIKKNIQLISFTVIIMVVGLYIGSLKGQIVGLTDKSKMLLEVACQHPEELQARIDSWARSIHTKLSLSISYEEFRKSYKWPCD